MFGLTKFYKILFSASVLIAALFMCFEYLVITPLHYDTIIAHSQDDSLRVCSHIIQKHMIDDVKPENIAGKVPFLIEDHDTYTFWKVRLFDADGKILFSTANAEIGTQTSSNPFYEIVQKGGHFSKMVKKGKVTESSGKATVDVVETYCPIMKDGKFYGAFELYFDVTERIARANELNQYGHVLTVSLCGLFLGIMFALSRYGSGLQREREKNIEDLKKANEEIKALGGLLPICSKCKCIRDDEGYWHKMETYISSHSDAEFSHGLCVTCAKELYPEFTPSAAKITKSDQFKASNI